MYIKLTEKLSLMTEFPILEVENFQFQWKPNCHALLKMTGYINKKIQWEPVRSYGQQIKIILDDSTFFFGYIVAVNCMIEGGLTQVHLEAMSASYLLDSQIASCSFQDVHKTYGEIVSETVMCEGGQVIRNKKSDKEIETPIIRYKETSWEFAVRLAGCLGISIIPDIETGNHNIWFGMREGRIVPLMIEEQYTVQRRPVDKNSGIRYKVESRESYKIGDSLTYQGHKITITEIEANYLHGELIFSYVLDEKINLYKDIGQSTRFTGLGLWGTIKNIRGDSVKIELDIDGGKDTGTYYYPWYPDTGNALYAMPERGARALLYLYNARGQDGAVIHCMNRQENESKYVKNRYLHIKNEKNIDLSGEAVSFSDESQGIVLGDGIISFRTSNGLKLLAVGGVHLRARKIIFSTPDEIDISQG